VSVETKGKIVQQYFENRVQHPDTVKWVNTVLQAKISKIINVPKIDVE
jgi:hypothetical protein